MVNLGCAPEKAGFTPEQAKAIIEVARFIAAGSSFGPDDPVTADSAGAIERTWSGATASQGTGFPREE